MTAVQLQSRELVLETNIPNLGVIKAVYLKPAHSVCTGTVWVACEGLCCCNGEPCQQISPFGRISWK